MRLRFRRAIERFRQFLLAVVFSVWRFLGRLGLAFRNLLAWVIWKPLFYLTMPVWLPLRWLLWDTVVTAAPPIWRFIGRLGLALRHLLTAYLWRPFLFLIIRPLVWCYQRILKPAAFWLAGRIWQLLRWIGRQIQQAGRTVWQVTEPQRTLYGRRFGSRWQLFKARLRVMWRRPKLPMAAVIAPARPRGKLTCH